MSSSASQGFTELRYQYRDSANFKVSGVIILGGNLSDSEQREVQSKLDGGEFFIAEQIGLPPLYAALYEFSGGPTDDDHCWHEFVKFRPLSVAPDGMQIWGSVANFLSNLRDINCWNERLSPHFNLVRPE